MNRELLGADVMFTVSEPEEFFFENGEGPFKAKIVDIISDNLVLKNEDNLRYLGKYLTYLVASRRHQNDSFENIFNDQRLFVNLIPILQENDIDEMDVSKVVSVARSWRRGHLIGGLFV